MKLDLKDTGAPVKLDPSIHKLPNELKHPLTVCGTRWANDPTPWVEYPVKSNKMHYPIEAHYLYDLSKKMDGGDIANLGVGKGSSVAYLAYGLRDSNKVGTVYGIDLFNYVPGMDIDVIEGHLKSVKLDKYVKLYKGFTQDWAEKLSHLKLKLLFIDADHHYETCKQDFDLWSPMVQVNGFVAFHDVDLSSVDRVIRELDNSKWILVDHIACTKTFRRMK